MKEVAMSNPSATSSGDSMPDGLGLDAWWNEPAYKRCDSFPRRGVFILNHLLQRDPIKFVYVMYNLYRAASIDAGEITASQWKTILKYMGATDEEIRGVQMRMRPPSVTPVESQSQQPTNATKVRSE
jgi:hypothetical protein